ncbi:class I SAM-dependent methyltransferase [Adhaeribacter aquaticus]|uniref:class I SAM-dependent methyltransferase n=1 Tax=Adhaeribacter aquaticus TaxID=299567 RepID=UPI00047E2A3C|nr:class I SAM-dependent methyltransferase [Adhaeribacter aquaticus]
MKWNTNLYDNKHEFVSQYGQDVVELLSPKEGELILDLGCGTGDLAAVIRDRKATVIGIDSSPDMIETASKKYPDIQFEVKSATDFTYEQKFDAIFSNATLHWVLDYKKAIACIYDNLKENGGRFVAEFGGKGNVASIIDALKSTLRNKGYISNAEKTVWYFPSLPAYTSLLEEAGFRVTFAAHFDRPTLLQDGHGLKNWLRMFATSYLAGLSNDVVETVLQDVEDQLRETNLKDGAWYADYVRLRVVASK